MKILKDFFHIIIKNKKEIAISLILSFFYYLFIFFEIKRLFYCDSIFKKLLLVMFITFGYIILSSIIYVLLYFYKNRKKHSKFIEFFSIYFIIMMIFLFLTWPGIFKGDEYDVIHLVCKMKFSFSQHYLTSIFYIISLCIIPTVGGITFFQILIISIIVGYILYNIEKKLKHKNLIYIFYILLIFPPIIDNNLFTLRSSLISFLFLLFIFQLIFFEQDKRKIRILYIGFIAAIISAWKMEFMYLPFILFVYFLIFHIKAFGFKRIFFYFIILLCLFTFFNIPQKTSKLYIFTAVLNPLSMLATYDDIETTISKTDVENIEKFVTFEQLRKSSSFLTTPLYWTDKINIDILNSERRAFLISYVKLVMANPIRFVDVRIKTYLYTNFATDKYPNHTGWEQPSSQWNLYHNKSNYVNEHFKFVSNGLGTDFKKNIISTILLRNPSDYTPNSLNHWFYNVTPTIIISLLSLIILALRKKWKYLFMMIIILLQFPIIFSTAPTIFWMYYICLYIVLNFFILYLLISYIDNKFSIKL